MDVLNHTISPDLKGWIFVKERGAIAHSGNVYRSTDSKFYLRTGALVAIRSEAEFGRMAWQQGFPVPEVTDVGELPNGLGYFIEKSVGTETFGSLLGREYAATGSIGEENFDTFSEISLRFLAAQLKPSCRQSGPAQIRTGIQLENVLHENPDAADLFEQAVVRAEGRTRGLPLVLTHGDLSPFNIMPGGVIDFEERFVAPAGLDTITCIAFQQFWDHPKPNGTGSMRLWKFDSRQVAGFLSRADDLFAVQGLPLLSGFFDDFLMLKAIWALSYERPDKSSSTQAQRWLWRKRVAVHCAERYLLDDPIQSESFRAIGLEQRSSYN